jgi:hypothetical protein
MLVKWCWAILALIHVAPALALFKPVLLTSLYGVQTGTVTYVLLHHRAALFVGVLVTCIWSLLQPESRQLGAVVVGVSMLSFLMLYVVYGMPESLRVIAVADLIGLPFLMIAGWQAFRGQQP